MKTKLLYGKKGIDINLPEDKTTVITPKPVNLVNDPAEAVRQALRNPIGAQPLRNLISPQDSISIVFSDITRPMPYEIILPILLEELRVVPRENIILINALGTHRPHTQDELIEILGKDILDTYQVIQHDCHSKADLVSVGRSSHGHDLLVNRYYMNSSVKILTGFLEPHHHVQK